MANDVDVLKKFPKIFMASRENEIIYHQSARRMAEAFPDMIAEIESLRTEREYLKADRDCLNRINAILKTAYLNQ